MDKYEILKLNRIFFVSCFFRNVEKVVRERFGKMVSRGMEEMRVTRATHSPISSLIDKAVIEVREDVKTKNDNKFACKPTKPGCYFDTKGYRRVCRGLAKLPTI